MPVVPREPISEDIDAAILGAGFCGMLAAIELKKAGVTNFRTSTGPATGAAAGTGTATPAFSATTTPIAICRCSKKPAIMPKKKFEDGWDIYQHCSADRQALRPLPDTRIFHTLVTALRWDESIERWRLTTNRGDDIRARFVVMAGGPLNKPKLPGIPGISKFKGKIFHTARWEYDYTGGTAQNPVLDKLADKRVAIIGTGATAIQIVPYLGRYAKQPTSSSARLRAWTSATMRRPIPSG